MWLCSKDEINMNKCIKCKAKLVNANWNKSNQKIGSYICKDCDKKRKTNARKKVRAEVIKAYGGFCKCCGESEQAFLGIDHIDNTGYKHRKEVRSGSFYVWLKNNNYPTDNYQLMCHNCNLAKSIYGKCPHKKKKK